MFGLFPGLEALIRSAELVSHDNGNSVGRLLSRTLQASQLAIERQACNNSSLSKIRGIN